MRLPVGNDRAVILYLAIRSLLRHGAGGRQQGEGGVAHQQEGQLAEQLKGGAVAVVPVLNGQQPGVVASALVADESRVAAEWCLVEQRLPSPQQGHAYRLTLQPVGDVAPQWLAARAAAAQDEHVVGGDAQDVG